MIISTIVPANQTVSHVNNLDFLRLFFAISVLITHSYALSGLVEYDVLQQFSHNQASLSHTAVQGFLIISGYLISKSLMRSPTLIDYYINRVLRVFPGLLVLLCLTVAVCFFFSNKSLAAYLGHYSTRDYLIFNSLLRIQYKIDGVFTHNPYPGAVNGSLWTIPYEVFFYIVLSTCFLVRTNLTLLRWLFGSAFVLAAGLFLLAKPTLHTYQLHFWYLNGPDIAELGSFFLSGAIWATLPMPTVSTRQRLAILSALLLVASFYFGGYQYLQFLLLPVVVIAFGMLNTSFLGWARKFGDFSYGIYLWGFLVQQSLMHLFHLSLLQLMAISIPVTYLCGALSWHLIEKRALRFKKRRQPESVSLKAGATEIVP
jgi:peptidoglycan/LPS O-acetylase OafA/YrhL